MAPPAGRQHVARCKEGPFPRRCPASPTQQSHNSVSATACCLAEWPFLDVACPVPFS